MRDAIRCTTCGWARILVPLADGDRHSTEAVWFHTKDCPDHRLGWPAERPPEAPPLTAEEVAIGAEYGHAFMAGRAAGYALAIKRTRESLDKAEELEKERP